MGGVVEDPAYAVVVPAWTVDGLPQVVRPTGLDLLPGLLGAVSGAGKVAVEQGRDDPIGRDGGRRAAADPVLLPARVIGGENDAARGDLWLIDRGYRLRVVRQFGPHPGKLRRVDSGHLDDRDVNPGVLVQQLTPQR